MFESGKIELKGFKKFLGVDGELIFKPFNKYCLIYNAIEDSIKHRMFGTGEMFRGIHFNPHLIKKSLEGLDEETVIKIELLQYPEATIEYKSLFSLKINFPEEEFIFILSLES